MTLVNKQKADTQFCKFIENLQRVIGKTKAILETVMNDNPSIRSSYRDIPGTLDMGLSLINSGSMFHQKIFRAFIEKGIDHFDMIHRKDDRILTHNLSMILPENEYVNKIQYIYGANPERRRYVSDEDVKVMWNLLLALMHRSIKWILFTEDPEFYPRLPPDVVQRYKVNLDS